MAVNIPAADNLFMTNIKYTWGEGNHKYSNAHYVAICEEA